MFIHATFVLQKHCTATILKLKINCADCELEWHNNAFYGTNVFFVIQCLCNSAELCCQSLLSTISALWCQFKAHTIYCITGTFDMAKQTKERHSSSFLLQKVPVHVQ